MARVREHLPDRSLLDELARVHDADPVADAHDRTEVVADEEHGRAVAPAKLTDEIEHGRLHRHVEAGGGLIHDQERGLGDEGHGDHDALLLAARELVRVAGEHALAVEQLDLREHVEGPGTGRPLAQAFVEHWHFHELAAHRHHRVEARHRVLVDHGDPAPPHCPELSLAQAGDVAPLEEDAAPVIRPARPR